jgi:hypothetical protein
MPDYGIRLLFQLITGSYYLDTKFLSVAREGYPLRDAQLLTPNKIPCWV